MATKTNNGPKANPGEIKQALNFLKELLPHNLVRSIGILLHPCCNFNIVDVKITCSDKTPGSYNIVFTIDNPLSYFDSIIATVTNTSSPLATVSSDGRTITVEDVTITSVPGNFVVTLLYPTVLGPLPYPFSVSGVYRSSIVPVTSDQVPTC